MKVKILRYSLIVLGFTFQYIIPFILFGRIIPYTHGEIGAGLTKMGILALCVFALILVKKLKRQVDKLRDPVIKEVLISLIEAIPIVVVAIFLNWLVPAVLAMRDYWYDIIPMFVVGRVLTVMAAAIYNDEKE